MIFSFLQNVSRIQTSLTWLNLLKVFETVPAAIKSGQKRLKNNHLKSKSVTHSESTTTVFRGRCHKHFWTPKSKKLGNFKNRMLQIFISIIDSYFLEI